MSLLVAMAFGVSDYQVKGKFSWIGSEYYDISAKAEGDSGLTYEQLEPLLQQLLAQRFKLTVHREMKDLSGYALVTAKDGPKLVASKGGSEMGMILGNGLRAPNISMQTFAAMLSHPLGRPVIDKTAITGNYSVKLSYAPEGSADSPLPSIFTAVQEQMGLTLEPRKVPVEMLVIDHVEKIPTETKSTLPDLPHYL